jgi:hypothetical protein
MSAVLSAVPVGPTMPSGLSQPEQQGLDAIAIALRVHFGNLQISKAHRGRPASCQPLCLTAVRRALLRSHGQVAHDVPQVSACRARDRPVRMHARCRISTGRGRAQQRAAALADHAGQEDSQPQDDSR